jgi:hypothetical protein
LVLVSTKVKAIGIHEKPYINENRNKRENLKFNLRISMH